MVKDGDLIAVNYVGKFPDGEVFDTNDENVARDAGTYVSGRTYEPLEFVVGKGMMIKGFETGVVGMEVGDSKTLTLEAEDAYGNYDQELIKILPLEMFTDAGIEPKIGEIFTFNVNLQGKILEINENEVKIDFNSPMAGKTLVFDITVVENKGQTD